MSTHKKKNKRAGAKAGTVEHENFDYSALIPKNLDVKSRELVQQFLSNQLKSDAERDEAVLVFAQALMTEQGSGVEGMNSPTSQDLSTHSLIGSRMPAGEVADAVIDAASTPVAATTVHCHGLDEQPTSTPQRKCVPANDEEDHANIASPRDDYSQPLTSDCFSEARTRINVGWLAGPDDAKPMHDKAIAVYSQRLGCKMYNFVSYPVGGVLRGFHQLSGPDDEVPAICLPDLQLQNHLWETYVNGQLSSWIDCDSSETWLASLSEREIVKELNYACYLGLRSVVIPLKHASSPRLASVLRKWLWTKNVNLALWVFVPANIELLKRQEGDPSDVWTVWANFREACNNYSSKKLLVGIGVSPDIDDEFIDPKLLGRWKGEPLAAFWVDSDCFVGVSDNTAVVLSRGHANLLSSLWFSDAQRILIRASDGGNAKISDDLLLSMACAVRVPVLNAASRLGIADCGFLSDGAIDYMDVLQMPLQPLSDNLDSGVYNTFEQDPIKYKRYREATLKAITDLGEAGKRPHELALYVLGAGRGPLVTASVEAAAEYNSTRRSRHDLLNVRIFVVEKNPNAIVTLHYCNEKWWKNRCKIIESDMRELHSKVEEYGFPKPDIIVSELLGSFGDNELSPECLDGVTELLKPETICIPQSYTSYVAPIHSTYMYQSIMNGSPSSWSSGCMGHGRALATEMDDGSYRVPCPQGREVANLDQVYVVFLRSVYVLSPAKPVFTFEHPNFELKSNERNGRIEFVVDMDVDIMGFAGYFHMTLYKDVVLSIEPSTHSPGMISWFPALIPLRKLHRIRAGEKVTFCIDRKVDTGGVWYEWCMEYEENGETKTTVLQNKDAESYYMRLQ